MDNKKKKEILNVITNLHDKNHTISFLVSAITDQVNCRKEDIKEVLKEEVQSGRLVKKYEMVCPIHNHILGFADFKNEIKEKYRCKECGLDLPIAKIKVLEHYYYNERQKYA